MIGEQGEGLVFLLGIPRSGTTLLSVMLDKHPQLRCPPEPWLMLALESLGRTSARHPSDAPVLYRAFREFCPPAAAIPAARAFATAACNRILAGSGKQILIDKTPRYYQILPYIQTVFPAARYVILWRNPLDVAASMKSTWGLDLPRMLAEHQDHIVSLDLVVGLRRLGEFARQRGDSVFSIQYERLVAEPAAVMSELAGWLGIAPAQGLENFDLAGGEFDRREYGDKKILSTHAPHQNSIGRWVQSFDPDAVRILLESIGVHIMKSLGYGAVVEQAAALGVAVEMAEARANSFATRLERSLEARLAEYDSVPTYSDLVVQETRLLQTLAPITSRTLVEPAGDLRSEIAAAADAAQRLADQAADSGRLRQSEAETRARLEESRQTNRGLLTDLATRQAELTSRTAELNSRTAELASRNADLAARSAELASRTAELATAARDRDQIQAQLQILHRELSDAANRVAHLDSAQTELRRELLEKTEEVRSVRQSRSEMESRFHEAQSRVAEMQTRLNEAAAQIDEITHRHAGQSRAKDQIIAALRQVDRTLDERVRLLLTSRLLRAGWKLGLGRTPDWADPATDPLAATQKVARAGAADGDAVSDALGKVGQLVRAGRPSVDEMDAAIEHLAAKGFSPTCVLDIGAAKGYWTERFAWRWKQAEFFMIDPLAESEPNLKAICARDKRFHYILAAAGRATGELVMNLTADHDGSSLLPFPNSDPARQRRVPVVTMDGLLAEGRIHPPQLVKLDVQGFELQVLDGGQRLFESAEVFIVEVSLFAFMEGQPRVHEVVNYMAERGFFVFDLAGLLRRPFEDDLGQMDLVFVSGKSSLVSSNRWS